MKLPTGRSTNRHNFKNLPKERLRELATQGAKAVSLSGNRYKFTSEKAREAGIKGGHKTSQNREFMRKIGLEGRKKRTELERLRNAEKRDNPHAVKREADVVRDVCSDTAIHQGLGSSELQGMPQKKET